MILLFHLILLAALACLTVFQTNRSIYIRSLGLFLILASTLAFELQSDNVINLGLIIGMSVLLILGFASDYYAASLRTWYFRVDDQAIWGLIIGGFLGLFFSSSLSSLLPFIVGSLLGAMIGQIRAKGFRSFPQIGKATLGTFAGVFGMSVKLLLGIEMVYWFLLATPPQAAYSPNTSQHDFTTNSLR